MVEGTNPAGPSANSGGLDEFRRQLNLLESELARRQAAPPRTVSPSAGGSGPPMDLTQISDAQLKASIEFIQNFLGTAQRFLGNSGDPVPAGPVANQAGDFASIIKTAGDLFAATTGPVSEESKATGVDPAEVRPPKRTPEGRTSRGPKAPRSDENASTKRRRRRTP